MSDTLHERGRPKGSTNEVLLQKRDEDKKKRDEERMARYSRSDVMTRMVKNLLKGKDNSDENFGEQNDE